MNINRRHVGVAAFAFAIALLVTPVSAERKQDRNRPVEITFTKWVTGPCVRPR